MSGLIPDPKPIVRTDVTADKTIAICHVPRCGWSYSNVVKSDVIEHARHHRQHHRAAAGRVEA